MAETEQTNLTSLTVDLLSAYFANNTVDSGELSGLIRSTHEALRGIDSPPADAPAAPEFKPAVTVRASLASKDHIVSLIDGKSYKTLKRHLSTHGLTPVEYRERYKLPRDYPMVAPSYSQARRDVAARLGLGRKPSAAASAPVLEEAPVEAAIEAAAPVATPPKPQKAAPQKRVAKTPTKITPAKRKATSKVAPAPAEVVPPTVDAASSPAVSATVPPKKAGRKPKAAASAPKSTASAKPAAKRAPRKPREGSEPAAS